MNKLRVVEDIRQVMEHHRIERIETDTGVLFQMNGRNLEVKQNVSIKERGHHLKEIK